MVMQVTVEDLSSVKKVLHVEIPEEEVTRELDNAYKQLKKNAKIKGFRPGKVPRSVLERMFKKDVNADVASRLIQKSFVDAVRETELKIVGDPNVEPTEIEADSPYKYDATVEIAPEIEDIDYKGLSLEKTEYQVSDGEVEAQLKMLQKNMAKLNPLAEERPLQDGDFALIDYEGYKDGKPFAETQKTENYSLKIGDGTISKDLDEGLKGMNAGETREVKVVFPEDYFNKKLAGLEIDFHVTLNSIREESLPELDDDFAKQLGKYETVADVEKEIRSNMTQGYEKRTEQELNEQIFKALLGKVEFEVPESMVEAELKGIIADAERSFQYHNTSMEDLGMTREGFEEKYRETAEKQVKRLLILRKIVEQEKMTCTDDDLKDGFKEMAENLNQPAEQIETFYKQNKEQLDYFKHSLLEKKAIRLIMDNSKIKTVKPKKEAKKKK
jgi:trigger factor